MTELIHEAGDAALLWLRRHLATILSIAAAAGFARAELVNMGESLDEARLQLSALHRDFVDFRLNHAGVSKETLAEAVARQRETDRRQDEELQFYRARILALGDAFGRERLDERGREERR